MSSLGERIRTRRHQLKLSQAALAAEMGIPQQWVSEHERSKHDPLPDILAKYVKALRTSADYILGFTEDPEPITSEDRQWLSLLHGDKAMQDFALQRLRQKMLEGNPNKGRVSGK